MSWVANSSYQQRDAGTEELRLELERVLTARFGRQCRIDSLWRRRSEFASSHSMEDFDVVLGDGTELQLVGKAIGSDGMLEDARRTRPSFLQHPMREAALYESLLPVAGASVPTGYGVVSTPTDRRKRLILERIEGLELRRIGSFDVWKRAARQLAVLQNRIIQLWRGFPLERRPPLVQYDQRYYRRWIARAAESQSGIVGSTAVEMSIRRLAAGYDRIVDCLCSLPRLVVHGDCFASNVLVADGNESRICFVDWEMAGFGPGLFDVAALVSGTWTERDREELLSAYRDGLLASGRCHQTLDEMMHVLDMCRLHLAVQMLGWSPDWEPPSEQRQDWLAEALQLAERLGL